MRKSRQRNVTAVFTPLTLLFSLLIPRTTPANAYLIGLAQASDLKARPVAPLANTSRQTLTCSGWQSVYHRSRGRWMGRWWEYH